MGKYLHVLVGVSASPGVLLGATLAFGVLLGTLYPSLRVLLGVPVP